MSYQKIKKGLASAARLIDSDKVAEAYDLILGLRDAGLSRSDMDANLTEEHLRKLREHSRMRRRGSAGSVRKKYPAVMREIDGDYQRHAITRDERRELMEAVEKAETEGDAQRIVDQHRRGRVASPTRSTSSRGRRRYRRT